MNVMIMIFLVSLAAVITGSSILLQMGGWLQILVAILILLYYFLSVSVICILVLGESIKKKKET